MKQLVYLMLMLLCVSLSANASSRRGQNETPPPQIYKDRVQSMLDSLVVDEMADKISPLSEEQQQQLREAMRSADAFSFDTPKDIVIKNHTIPLSLSNPGIPVIKLGHTFNTTLIFTDAAGNPWSVETLADVSNTDVVSVAKKAPNIITIKPLKSAGKTNLPVKLTGQQRPITFLFDISDEEVYFDVDIQVDAMGDHVDSQKMTSMTHYQNKQTVAPRLNLEPEKSLLLQFMTPEGYEERRLFDENRKPVDPRDFMAWTKGEKVFLLTPHAPFSPDPLDYIASPDGVHKLLEYKKRPVIAVRKNAKIFWLHIE